MGTNLCLKCGYDIRNLPSSICPECGTDDRRVRPRYPILVHVLLWFGLLVGGVALLGMLLTIAQGTKLEWAQFAPLIFWSSIGLNSFIRLYSIHRRRP